MASVPPDQLAPNLRVFRLAPNGRDLSEIPCAIWQQIACHERPLQPANGSVKLLLISGTSDECKAIDALRLQTDSFGFLMTFLVTYPGTFPGTCPGTSNASNPTARPAAQAANLGTIVDARHRFLQRYIAHRHSWQPTPALLAQAISLAGYADLRS